MINEGRPSSQRVTKSARGIPKAGGEASQAKKKKKRGVFSVLELVCEGVLMHFEGRTSGDEEKKY